MSRARHRLTQPGIGAITLTASLTILALSWAVASVPSVLASANAVTVPAAACLTASVVLAYRFPIYIRHKTKVCVFTAPLYLLTVFLSPPLAAAAAGLSILLGELTVRVRHASGLGDITTQTGRWVVVVLAGSLVAHAAPTGTSVAPRLALLLLTGLVLFAGDLLTVPLALVPMSQERIDRIVLACVRGAGLIETAQYGIGVLGVLALEHAAWASILLVMPVVLLYLLYNKEADRDTYLLIESMADAVDLRDPYTVDHSRRVAEIVREILIEMGRNGQEAALIWTAARVHDVGKAEIPDHVLLKTGPLTAGERAEIQAHGARGAELLATHPNLGPVVEMVRHHHEHWDGSGYPDMLREYDIPFGARLIAVADSFDAMTSDRAYRMALSRAQAVQTLREGRGRQWDPVVVDALLRCLERAQQVTDQRAHTGLRLDGPEAYRSAAGAWT